MGPIINIIKDNPIIGIIALIPVLIIFFKFRKQIQASYPGVSESGIYVVIFIANYGIAIMAIYYYGQLIIECRQYLDIAINNKIVLKVGELILIFLWLFFVFMFENQLINHLINKNKESLITTSHSTLLSMSKLYGNQFVAEFLRKQFEAFKTRSIERGGPKYGQNELNFQFPDRDMAKRLRDEIDSLLDKFDGVEKAELNLREAQKLDPRFNNDFIKAKISRKKFGPAESIKYLEGKTDRKSLEFKVELLFELGDIEGGVEILEELELSINELEVGK